MEKKHPWKARLGVGITMLLLAFIGMVTTDLHASGTFSYWKWVVPVYALLALWLSWYIRRQQETLSPITLGHEFLHWVGVIAAVFLVSYFAHLGSISRFVEGIFDLTILSLGIFLAGVYIETTFLFIGLVLGIFAFLSATVVQYLYAFLVPILIGAALVLALMVWIAHKKAKNQ